MSIVRSGETFGNCGYCGAPIFIREDVPCLCEDTTWHDFEDAQFLCERGWRFVRGGMRRGGAFIKAAKLTDVKIEYSKRLNPPDVTCDTCCFCEVSVKNRRRETLCHYDPVPSKTLPASWCRHWTPVSKPRVGE